MWRTSLCDHSDAYMLLSGTITITGAGNDDAMRWLDERNEGSIFKNVSPFTDCISEKNNIQVDNAKYIDVIMPIYNLIECSGNYSKHQEVCGNITDTIQLILQQDLNHSNTRLKKQEKLLPLEIQRMLK